MTDNNQKGVTLLELTVVLLILIALAGLAIPYIGGTSRKVLCDATDVSMANIKKAIMDRYYLDTLGGFPVTKGGSDYSLTFLFDKGGWQDFDPDSQVGWRGPYVQGGVILASTADVYKASNLSSSFTGSTTYVNKKLADTQTIILDSWGRPIIIQVVNKADCIASAKWSTTTTEDFCARLVSAGSGSGVGIANAGIETTLAGHRPTSSDDRILYLNAPTPAVDINPSCGD